jgi:hypothetical protein
MPPAFGYGVMADGYRSVQYKKDNETTVKVIAQKLIL